MLTRFRRSVRCKTLLGGVEHIAQSFNLRNINITRKTFNERRAISGDIKPIRPHNLEHITFFLLSSPPNGLRYLRWGGGYNIPP